MPVSFFYIFFVFFLLANIFSRYSGALCCVVPAFGPHCPRPSHISFFFVVSLCLHLVSKGCPSPATHHINPAPPTFSSSVNAVPLCCVNAPGIGHSYIISLHYKWVVFFFFLLSPSAHSCFLSVVHTWHLLIPPCRAPTLRQHLHQLPATLTSPSLLLGSSMPATVRVCPPHFVSCFLFLFVLSLLTCSMPTDTPQVRQHTWICT